MRMFLIPAVALVLSACHFDMTSTSHTGLSDVDAATHCQCGSGALDGGGYGVDAGTVPDDGGYTYPVDAGAFVLLEDGGSSGSGCNCGGEPDGGIDYSVDAGSFPVD